MRLEESLREREIPEGRGSRSARRPLPFHSRCRRAPAAGCPQGLAVLPAACAQRSHKHTYVYNPFSIFRRVGAISSSSSYAYAWGAVAIASFIASAMYLTLPPPPPSHYLLLLPPSILPPPKLGGPCLPASQPSGWCYPTGRCAYLPSVICYRQSIKPPPPPPPCFLPPHCYHYDIACATYRVHKNRERVTHTHWHTSTDTHTRAHTHTQYVPS